MVRKDTGYRLANGFSWSVFFYVLGLLRSVSCYSNISGKGSFAQEKLNNVLSNYNYQLFRKCQQSTDIQQDRNKFHGRHPSKRICG